MVVALYNREVYASLNIEDFEAALEVFRKTPRGKQAIRAAARLTREHGEKKGREIHWAYCAKCKLYFAARDIKLHRKCPHEPTTQTPLKKLPKDAILSKNNKGTVA